MPQSIRRIGVLTGGGDCPGLNAVIRAVVKTAIQEHGWEVYGIEDGFEGLIQPGRVRPLGLDDVRGILPRGGTILGTTNRANPFHYEVQTPTGVKVFDVSDQVVQKVQVLGLDALIVIGGDGSLRIAYELMEKGLQVVGVPKTIDNDIQQTLVTFGFDTALNTAMEALDKLHTTAESHHRVILLEVMGRDAGWIALEAGIAGGADVILIPEIPYQLNEVLAKIKDRSQGKAKFSILVVAEGAKTQGGQAIYQTEQTVGAAPRLGGVGSALADQLRQHLDAEVRVTVLGYLQRGGSPTAFDRLLGSRFGAMAVELVAAGQFGQMVSLHHDRIVAVPIAAAVQSQKFVPHDSDLITTALGLGISLGCSRPQLNLLRQQASQDRSIPNS